MIEKLSKVQLTRNQALYIEYIDVRNAANKLY